MLLPVRRLAWLAVPALLPVTSPLPAQTMVSQPVVQPGVGSADPEALARAELQRQLTEALGNIAADGTNWFALSQAGRAALGLGDARAALGFLSRAEALAPRDATIKAALGATMVQLEDPGAAMRYFDAAVAAGGIERAYLGDRGLAFDLLGDQRRAQADYAVAMRDAPSAELTRRYAISLGISGQPDQAVQLLAPLLRNQDRAAWRSRAMIVAMNGRADEARQIARTTMPGELATALDPYFALMDRLTPDQLAAASHFGRFPTYDALRSQPSRAAATRIAAAAPARAETPAPRGRRERGNRRADRSRASTGSTNSIPAARNARTAASAPAPAPAAAPAAVRTAQVRAPVPSPAPSPAAAPTAIPVVQPLPAAATPNPAAATPLPTPASALAVAGPPDSEPRAPAPIGVAALPATASAAATPPGATAAAPALVATVPVPTVPQPDTNVLAGWSLASVVGGMEVPDAERAASAGALSIADLEAVAEERRRVQAAEAAARATEAQARATARAEERAAARTRAATEAEARRREEARVAAEAAALLRANPARNWVQVATGANPAALAGDCRRLARQYAANFRSQSCATAEWGRTRRLLVGPFRNAAAARDWDRAYRAAGGDGFVWNSDAGEVVTPIGGR